MSRVIRRPHKPFGDIELMARDDLRELVQFIEDQAVKFGRPVEVPIKHHFSRGLYAREMKMPAGALVVGKIHKYDNLNVLSEGEVSVLSQDGVKRHKAPFTFTAGAGAKRAIYAHTPCTWTVFHATSKTSLMDIEDEVIAKSYDEVENLIPEVVCLGS